MHTSISKEEIEELPLGKFTGEITIVDNPEDLQIVADELKDEKVIGFDTETKPAFKKGQRNEVALLQLSTVDKAYLIRLNKTGLTNEILNIFTNPEVKKVGVGIRDDIKALQRLKPFNHAGFIELQDFAKVAGLESFSLKKLAALVMNIRVSKRQRLSNWEAENFTESQANYAATDAWAALQIYLGMNRLFPELYVESLTF